jgi:hypothetical protein
MADAPAITPPAAPAAPSTPAPAPASSAPTPSSPTAGNGAWDALDALGSDDDAPAAPAATAAAPARPKDDKGRFVKPPEKPAEPPKDIDPSKMKAGELAKHYHASKSRVAELEKKMADYEAKSKAPQEWPEKKTYDQKVADYEKRLEEHSKKVAEYETELKFTQYEKSQEYKEKYQKPFETAYLAGRSKAAALKVVERKNDEGAVLQQTRKGTAEDFDALMAITDDDVAAEKAVEMFGNKAPMVLYHRERANELNNQASSAIKEYREKGAEREKQMREQQEKWHKDASSMIDREMTAAVEKYPKFFKPDDADPKGNELLETGRETLERVLRGGVPLKDGQAQWTHEEYSRAVAQVRNGAIAFPRVAHRLSLANKEIKELKARLADFEISVPGNGDGRGRTPVPSEKTPDQILDDMAVESRR